MGHVTLHTPMSDELSAGIVCIEVQGLSPDQVVQRLHQRRILISVTPYAIKYARLSPCILNTPQQIDITLAAVRDLA